MNQIPDVKALLFGIGGDIHRVKYMGNNHIGEAKGSKGSADLV